MEKQNKKLQVSKQPNTKLIDKHICGIVTFPFLYRHPCFYNLIYSEDFLWKFVKKIFWEIELTNQTHIFGENPSSTCLDCFIIFVK